MNILKDFWIFLKMLKPTWKEIRAHETWLREVHKMREEEGILPTFLNQFEEMEMILPKEILGGFLEEFVEKYFSLDYSDRNMEHEATLLAYIKKYNICYSKTIQ